MQNEKRHSYKNTSLSKYQSIIKSYWEEFDEILEDEKQIIPRKRHDPRTVELIRHLKVIDTWKSNLFILYLHFNKLGKMAEELQVKESSLSVYLSNIKKELRYA